MLRSLMEPNVRQFWLNEFGGGWSPSKMAHSHPTELIGHPEMLRRTWTYLKGHPEMLILRLQFLPVGFWVKDPAIVRRELLQLLRDIGAHSPISDKTCSDASICIYFFKYWNMYNIKNVIIYKYVNMMIWSNWFGDVIFQTIPVWAHSWIQGAIFIVVTSSQASRTVL